ncbi:MAG TPA: 3-deoxy-8-phosphooctulonate synthase [Acidobacteriota bacterium]|nr:3-deoxy-8-phosphooctulonate synthase [Acidobacteriota bacterium]
MKPFRIGGVIEVKDGAPFFFIGGPCVIESADHIDFMCGKIKEICSGLKIPFVFKASYDKANRSSIQSFRGPGPEEGARLLEELKRKHSVPVLTDIHEPWQAEMLSKSVDVLQIPAFLCRQTDLLLAAGKTGAVVNVKKGQFMAPHDMKNAVEKIKSTGNEKVLLTERGVSFGYNNLVVDFRSLEMMKKLDCAVVFDATHSVQLPGGEGTRSGGQREFIEPLGRAAVAVGIHGLFMEVHDRPDQALSDGPNACPLDRLPALLERLLEYDHISKKYS